jgi:hypothetical protein
MNLRGEGLPRVPVWRNLLSRTLHPPKCLSRIVPFEPKTDSNEFEITNLVPTATAENRGAAPDPADITICIWEDGSSDSAPLTWQSDSVLVYMIADLVTASHGRTADETTPAMAAHFNDSVRALVGAKRIQTAILELLSCRPGDCKGAAILIHPPVAGGFSQAMAQSALRLAEPGQIMLSPVVARRFQEFPGIELRAVPALTTGGTGHAGLMELVWTSAERLASLRNTAPAASTPDVGAPLGATMIVDRPSTASPNDVVSAGSRRRAASDAIEAAAKNTGEAGLTNGDATFHEGLEDLEERQSFVTKSRVVVGAIVIVLVVVGMVLFHPWSSSNVQPNPKQYETPTAEQPVTVPETPANVPESPPAEQPVPDVQAKPQPPVVMQPAIKKPALVAKEKPRKPEDTPIQGFEGNSTYDGMTQKDILRLLKWARSDAGNGNYEKAAQEYRVILQLQPNNPDAKEGLRKIQLAQGGNQ